MKNHIQLIVLFIGIVSSSCSTGSTPKKSKEHKILSCYTEHTQSCTESKIHILQFTNYSLLPIWREKTYFTSLSQWFSVILSASLCQFLLFSSVLIENGYASAEIPLFSFGAFVIVN